MESDVQKYSGGPTLRALRDPAGMSWSWAVAPYNRAHPLAFMLVRKSCFFCVPPKSSEVFFS